MPDVPVQLDAVDTAFNLANLGGIGFFAYFVWKELSLFREQTVAALLQFTKAQQHQSENLAVLLDRRKQPRDE